METAIATAYTTAVQDYGRQTSWEYKKFPEFRFIEQPIVAGVFEVLDPIPLIGESSFTVSYGNITNSAEMHVGPIKARTVKGLLGRVGQSQPKKERMFWAGTVDKWPAEPQWPPETHLKDYWTVELSVPLPQILDLPTWVTIEFRINLSEEFKIKEGGAERDSDVSWEIDFKDMLEPFFYGHLLSYAPNSFTRVLLLRAFGLIKRNITIPRVRVGSRCSSFTVQPDSSVRMTCDITASAFYAVQQATYIPPAAISLPDQLLASFCVIGPEETRVWGEPPPHE